MYECVTNTHCVFVVGKSVLFSRDGMRELSKTKKTFGANSTSDFFEAVSKLSGSMKFILQIVHDVIRELFALRIH